MQRYSNYRAFKVRTFKSEADEENSKPSELFKVLTSEWSDEKSISGQTAESLSKWLNDNYNFVEEENTSDKSKLTM